MSTRSLLHQARLSECLKRFADHKPSGLTVTDGCLQNNISKYKFFYWKRLLKDEAVTQMLPEIVPLAVPASVPAVPSEPATLSTTDTTSATRASCTTFTPNSCARFYINGMTIELDSSASESFIGILGIRSVAGCALNCSNRSTISPSVTL